MVAEHDALSLVVPKVLKAIQTNVKHMVAEHDALSLVVPKVPETRQANVKHMVAEDDVPTVLRGQIPGLVTLTMMATAPRVSSNYFPRMSEARLYILIQRKFVSAMPSMLNLKDSFTIRHFIQVNVTVL